MKIYLAGPDVFRGDAIEYGNALKALCKNYGHEGLFPFDNEVNPKGDEVLSKLIFEANFEMIKECDVVLANMEPFRGPSIDVGTAWEIGAAKALGKQVILYNSIGEDYNKRALHTTKFPNVEDFGLEDNLMIIHGSDHIFTSFNDAVSSL